MHPTLACGGAWAWHEEWWPCSRVHHGSLLYLQYVAKDDAPLFMWLCLFIVIIPLCWLVPLLMTLVTQLQQFLCGALVSDSKRSVLRRSHYVACAFVCFVSSASVQIESVMQTKWWITQNVFPSFDILFFELCIVWYNIQTILTTFWIWRNDKCLFSQTRNKSLSDSLHPNYTCILNRHILVTVVIRFWSEETSQITFWHS